MWFRQPGGISWQFEVLTLCGITKLKYSSFGGLDGLACGFTEKVEILKLRGNTKLKFKGLVVLTTRRVDLTTRMIMEESG